MGPIVYITSWIQSGRSIHDKTIIPDMKTEKQYYVIVAKICWRTNNFATSLIVSPGNDVAPLETSETWQPVSLPLPAIPPSRGTESVSHTN